MPADTRAGIRATRSRLVALVGDRVARSDQILGARVGRLVLSAPFVPARIRAAAAERLSQLALAVGAAPFLRGLLSRFASGDDEIRRLAHTVAMRVGDLRLATTIAQAPGSPTWESPANQTGLLADRLLGSGDPAGALASIDAAGLSDDSQLQAHVVRALQAVGQPTRLLETLDRNDGLGATAAAIAAFDAHWQLGDPEAAFASVADLAGGQLQNLELIRRLRDAHIALGGTADQAYEHVLDVAARSPLRSDVDWQLSLDFVFNRCEELLTKATLPHVEQQLRPSGRFMVAATQYVVRDFDGARATIEGLLGTTSHWAAQKLDDRMLLEAGRFTDALDHRLERSRLVAPLDEVAYFARLHLGLRADAFRTYLLAGDANRLRSTFGDTAEFLPQEHRRQRFVIAQDGPADELAMAATYAQLCERTDQVTATCDPRLTSLLRRSFPAIEFIPTPRQASRPRLGFLSDDQPDRATGNLYDLLTAEAMHRATAADGVSLGRSLIRLTPECAPYAPYLDPDRARVAELRDDLGNRPIVGVVWRSEFIDPMRSIHFLAPDELAPLTGLDVDFVCLQHDATASERRQLVDALGGRVSFADELDLRDDFDTMAALVAACSAVVGVGTTITELAAAVGTPTVYLHPNLIGAWRRGHDDRDYWHESMTAAVVDDAQHRRLCVDRAVDLLAHALRAAAGDSLPADD